MEDIPTLSGSAASSSAQRPSQRLRSLMLAVFCCAVGWLMFQLIAPQTVGEQARRIFEKQLSDHYSKWDVSIGRGTFQPGVGLVFESIRLVPRDQAPAGLARWWSHPSAVHVDRLTVVADVDVVSWLQNQRPITSKRIVIEGLVAPMQVDAQGNNSIVGLWPLPQLGPICPQIELHDSTFRIECQSADDTAADDRPIELHFSQIGVASDCTIEPNRGIATVSDGATSIVSRRIMAKGSSSFSGPIEINLRQEDLWEGDWSCQRMSVDTALLRRLAPLLGVDFCECPTLAGVNWQVVGDVSGSYHGRNDFVVETTIHDGSWIDPRLPSKIDQWRGRLQWTPTHLRLLPTQAHFNNAICRMSGQLAVSLKETVDAANSGAMSGLFDDVAIGAADVRVSAEGLSIDPSLAAVLPPKAAVWWNRFEPQGRLAGNLRLSNPAAGNIKTWDVAGNIALQGVDIRFDRFPYPVEQMVGPIEIAEGEIFSPQLTGQAGGQRLHCEFRVPIPATLCGGENHQASGNKTVIIRSEGPVPIDDALIEALTPRDVLGSTRERSSLESFVRSLHPSGEVELAEASVFIDSKNQMSRQFDLRVMNGSLRYDQFPYPLYNVAGRIQIQNDLVRVIGFTANNAGAAKVLCDGLVQMGDDSELNLRFRAADVAMDHSLRTSLPAPSRNVWDGLAPAGTLDRLDVHLTRHRNDPIVLTMTANQHETDGVRPDTLSIRPTALPYRLDILDGTLHYDGNRVEIKDLIARHDSSRLVADGDCVPLDDQHWKLSLDLHSGCRLTLDEELLTSLPPQMERAMRQLDLRGPVQLRGQTNVLLSELVDEVPTIDWNVLLQLEGNRIGDVGPVHSIRGEIQISGVSESEMVRAGGTVAIDSMHAMGLQLTSIRGPFSIEGNDLRLGTSSSPLDPISAAPDPAKTGPRRAPIVGNLFGGLLDISGAVSLSSGDFDVGASVGGGELSTLLAEIGQSRNDLRGRFDLNLRMEGQLGDMDLLKGTGNARLSGANLYQLPFVVQTLNLLRITPTEDVAFTDGESEFTFFGEDINFNRLTLWGDLVALDGGGTLTRSEQLDLSFNTRVSPQNLFSKVINPLRDERYTFWTIEVDGPLDGPTISRRSLSGIAQTMEEWFPGTVRSSTIK